MFIFFYSEYLQHGPHQTQVSFLFSTNTEKYDQSKSVGHPQCCFFFGRSVLDFNCRCLFSEKAPSEGKNFLIIASLGFFSSVFSLFLRLWCRDDGRVLRVTVFIEMEIGIIVLTLFALFFNIDTSKMWLQQACNTSTRISSISWLHVRFPFSRWYMCSGGWNTPTFLAYCEKPAVELILPVFGNELCSDLHCSLWCHTKTEQ